MIRQKHAKRESQTECEIHGQIHKVNYKKRERKIKPNILRASERAEKLRESRNPPADLKNKQINNDDETEQMNQRRSVSLSEGNQKNLGELG